MAYSDRASAEKKLSLELDFSSIDNSTHTSKAPASVDETPYRKKIFPREIKIVLEKNEDIVPVGYSGPYVLGITFNTGVIRYTANQSLTFTNNVLLPHERLHLQHLNTRGYFHSKEEFDTRFKLDQLYLK